VKLRLYRNTSIIVGSVMLAIAILLLSRVAVAAEKGLVKINYVTLSLLVEKKSGRSGDLSSISFSIENAATKPLEWVRLRATARSHDGALLQTDTFEEDLIRSPWRKRGKAPNAQFLNQRFSHRR
jgi:hypothetical protein